MSGTPADKSETVVIYNPQSGSGDHADDVRARAAVAGYEVRETEAVGDAVVLAEAAAEGGAETIAAAGGDGTLNEVVRGVDRADALDRVTVGVVPVGTGNNFAGNVGIEGLDEAFAVLASGERRQLDLGMAGDNPFVNSCVCGVTAEASGQTTPELKERFGGLAYLLTTLRTVREFDGLELTVEVSGGEDGSSVWSGEAISVLVGNCRRFDPGGPTQADVEDGRFDVAIIEEAPPTDLVGEQLLERLLGAEATTTTRLYASALEITVLQDDPVAFSLDGEMDQHRTLRLAVRPGALRLPVGEGYDPDPDVGHPGEDGDDPTPTADDGPS